LRGFSKQPQWPRLPEIYALRAAASQGAMPMTLHPLTRLKGFHLQARDRQFGKVMDFYFDGDIGHVEDILCDCSNGWEVVYL